MKRIAAFLAVVALGASGLFAAISNPAATVYLTKTSVISTADLDARVAEYRNIYQQQGQDPNLVKPLDVLNVMINNELFRQGAARAGIVITDQMIDFAIAQLEDNYRNQTGATDEQFRQAAIDRMGSWEAFRSDISDQILVQQYLQKEKGDKISQTPTVTDDEIQKTYTQYRTQFVQPENVKISHIFIPFDEGGDKTKDAANKRLLDTVAADIKSGKITFEEAVSQYSQDQQSKNSAGDIGWLTREDTSAAQMLGQDFIDQSFATPVGSTSDVITSLAGYHIVKILAHGDARILDLQDPIGPSTNTTLSAYIRAQLLQQKQQQQIIDAETELVNELRAQARIKVLYTE